jgi:hypothetical protein
LIFDLKLKPEPAPGLATSKHDMEVSWNLYWSKLKLDTGAGGFRYTGDVSCGRTRQSRTFDMTSLRWKDTCPDSRIVAQASSLALSNARFFLRSFYSTKQNVERTEKDVAEGHYSRR